MNIRHYDLQHEMQFRIESSGEVAGCLISSLIISGYSKIYMTTNSINSNISMNWNRKSQLSGKTAENSSSST